MSKQPPPIINIQMVPAGVKLVLAGLNKLPREESDELYTEILNQVNFQLLQIKSRQLAQQEADKGQQNNEGKSE